VRIIHGKGYGSNNQGPIIKPLVNKWLQQRNEILAFCSARPNDGGTGAVYVLLKTLR
jgi:DNA-nicking Smr family endonuclease